MLVRLAGSYGVLTRCSLVTSKGFLTPFPQPLWYSSSVQEEEVPRQATAIACPVPVLDLAHLCFGSQGTLSFPVANYLFGIVALSLLYLEHLRCLAEQVF